MFRPRGWKLLRNWGSSRLIKSSYFWLIFVPIAAKTLKPLPDEITFTVFGSALKFNFELPFRWKIFYFMSICFAFAQLAYEVWCPILIKQFKDFRAYRRTHSGNVILYDRLRKLCFKAIEGDNRAQSYWAIILNTAQRSANDQVRNAVNNLLYHPVNKDNTHTEPWLQDLIALSTNDEKFLNDFFDVLCAFESGKRASAMKFSAAFFVFGGLLFALLVVDSFLTVLR